MSSATTTPPRVEGQDWCDEETWVLRDSGMLPSISGKYPQTTYGVAAVAHSWSKPDIRRLFLCGRALAGTPLPADVEPGAITRELTALRAVADAAQELLLAVDALEVARKMLEIRTSEEALQRLELAVDRYGRAYHALDVALRLRALDGSSREVAL